MPSRCSRGPWHPVVNLWLFTHFLFVSTHTPNGVHSPSTKHACADCGSFTYTLTLAPNIVHIVLQINRFLAAHSPGSSTTSSRGGHWYNWPKVKAVGRTLPATAHGSGNGSLPVHGGGTALPPSGPPHGVGPSSTTSAQDLPGRRDQSQHLPHINHNTIHPSCGLGQQQGLGVGGFWRWGPPLINWCVVGRRSLLLV